MSQDELRLADGERKQVLTGLPEAVYEADELRLGIVLLHCLERLTFPSRDGETRESRGAPRIGETVDFDFKLCSKLTRPGALMLNLPELTITNEDSKAYLAVEVLLYAWVIVSRFHDINWVP